MGQVRTSKDRDRERGGQPAEQTPVDAERVRADADMAYLLEDARGRRVLARIRHFCKAHERLPEDPVRLQRIAGRDDVARMIVAEVNRHDPGWVPVMDQELAVPAEITARSRADS